MCSYGKLVSNRCSDCVFGFIQRSDLSMNTLKNHLLFFLIPFTLLVMVILFLLLGNHASAEDGNLNEIKRYETILVKEGDTLHSIANSYAKKLSYYSNSEYLEAILSLNSLDSEFIQSGKYILLPIYR